MQVEFDRTKDNEPTPNTLHYPIMVHGGKWVFGGARATNARLILFWGFFFYILFLLLSVAVSSAHPRARSRFALFYWFLSRNLINWLHIYGTIPRPGCHLACICVGHRKKKNFRTIHIRSVAERRWWNYPLGRCWLIFQLRDAMLFGFFVLPWLVVCLAEGAQSKKLY